MKLKFIFFALACLSLISCDEISDSYWDRKAEENYVSPYKGIYKGNYSGDEEGSLTIEVTKSGAVSVTKISSFGQEEAAFSGSVQDNGSLHTVTMKSGFTLLGDLTNKTGTWKLGNWKGTWSVKKE